MSTHIKTKTRSLLKGLLFALAGLGIIFTGVALAGPPTPVDLKDIALNIDTTVKHLATVLVDVCLIAGIGFIMAAFFKFHQHKLNPQQIPLSQGITLLLIGAGLTLFPTILPTASNSVFGKDAKIAKVGGGQIHSLISGSD